MYDVLKSAHETYKGEPSRSRTAFSYKCRSPRAMNLISHLETHKLIEQYKLEAALVAYELVFLRCTPGILPHAKSIDELEKLTKANGIDLCYSPMDYTQQRPSLGDQLTSHRIFGRSGDIHQIGLEFRRVPGITRVITCGDTEQYRKSEFRRLAGADGSPARNWVFVIGSAPTGLDDPFLWDVAKHNFIVFVISGTAKSTVRLAFDEPHPEIETSEMFRMRSETRLGDSDREVHASVRYPAVVPVGEGRVDRAVTRIISERTKRFFGREAEQASLDCWLHSFDRGTKLVLASAGVGKSALLANWIRHRRTQGNRVVQHFFAHRLPATLEAISGLDYLWRQLQEPSGLAQPSAPLDRERLANALAAELGRDHSQPLIMVLDGLDEAAEDFPSILPAGGVGKNVYVVLGLRDDGAEGMPKVAMRWVGEQDAAFSPEPLCLKPMDLPAIRVWLSAVRPDLAASGMDSWLRQLKTASHGLPLFLHFLLDEIRTAELASGSLPKLPERFRDYLERELDWIRESDREDWLQLLALLTCTLGPIAQSELALLKDDEGQLPFRKLSGRRIDRRIARWLLRTGEGRNPIYSFIHPRFAQAFAEVLPVDLIERVRQWLIVHAERWREPSMQYALQFGIQHLATGTEVKDALGHITDVDYLCARLSRLSQAEPLLQPMRLGKMICESPAQRNTLDVLSNSLLHLSQIPRRQRVEALRGLFEDFSGSSEKGVPRAIRMISPEPFEDSLPFTLLIGHVDEIRGAKVLVDGQVLTWSKDRTLRTWSNTGELLQVMKGHVDEIIGVTMSESLLCSQDRSGLRITWDYREGRETSRCIQDDEAEFDGYLDESIRRHDRLTSSGRELVQLRNSSNAIIAEWDGVNKWFVHSKRIVLVRRFELRIHDEDTGAFVASLQLPSSNALPVNSTGLVAWTLGSNPLLINLDDGRVEAELLGHCGEMRGALALSQRQFLTWSSDKSPRIWNWPTSGTTNRADNAVRSCSSARLSPERLISFCNHSFQLRDSGGRIILNEATCGRRNLEVISDSRFVLWARDNLQLRETENGSMIAQWCESTWVIPFPVRHVAAVSPDRFVIWGKRMPPSLWDEHGRLSGVMTGHGAPVRGISARFQERLLTWSWDGTLRVWNARNAGTIAVLDDRDSDIIGGELVALDRVVSSNAQETLLWDTQEGLVIQTFPKGASFYDGMRVLSSDRLLIWRGNTFWLSDLRSGALLAVRVSHSERIAGVKVLSGERFVSWDRSGCLRFWSASDCKEIDGPLELGARLAQLVVVSDGLIISWCLDGFLAVWDVRSKSRVTRFWAHPEGIRGVLILGEVLLSWGSHSLGLWNFDGKSIGQWIQPYGEIKSVSTLRGSRVVVQTSARTLFLELSPDVRSD